MLIYKTNLISIITFFLSLVYANDCSLEVGQLAPEFSLIDQNNLLHTLSDYRGNKLAIYFYPKDNTPGCTKQACSIRDNYSILNSYNIKILGISYDNPKQHQSFIKKYNLPFDLLSDIDKSVSKKYCADGWFMPQRKTILINEKGVVIHVFNDINVEQHANEILKNFIQIQNEK